MWEVIEQMAGDRLWIYTSIVGSLFGAAFLFWFKDTRMATWAVGKFDSFLEYLANFFFGFFYSCNIIKCNFSFKFIHHFCFGFTKAIVIPISTTAWKKRRWRWNAQRNSRHKRKPS